MKVEHRISSILTGQHYASSWVERNIESAETNKLILENKASDKRKLALYKRDNPSNASTRLTEFHEVRAKARSMFLDCRKSNPELTSVEICRLIAKKINRSPDTITRYISNVAPKSRCMSKKQQNELVDYAKSVRDNFKCFAHLCHHIANDFSCTCGPSLQNVFFRNQE